MKKFIISLLGLSYFLLHSLVWAEPPKTIVIKRETANFDLSIRYPEGFPDAEVGERIKAFIAESQKSAADLEAPDVKQTGDTFGKSSLYIDYKIEFQNKNALSILFTVSAYSQGAAHPSNSVKTFNFIQGQSVTLDHLFVPSSNYLNQIATICRKALGKKKMTDRDWLIKGTTATQENYRNWHFTKEGLAIVFDTYQVAPYFYGPQTVKIPKSELKNWLRPDVTKAVWGNQ